MQRFALIFTTLAVLLGVRCAVARQKPVGPPPVSSRAKGPRASEPELRRLVELIGVVEKELASIDVVLEMMKKQMPTIPEKAWPEVRAEFVKSMSRESIIRGYVAIYSTHFNAAEIRQLVAFYASPVGRKLVAEMPLIETEAFLDGVERGKEMAERLREVLKSKGYRVPST